MKKVFIVNKQTENPSNDGIRIFSTKEKAQKYCDELNVDNKKYDLEELKVEEYILDSEYCA